MTHVTKDSAPKGSRLFRILTVSLIVASVLAVGGDAGWHTSEESRIGNLRDRVASLYAANQTLHTQYVKLYNDSTHAGVKPSGPSPDQLPKVTPPKTITTNGTNGADGKDGVGLQTVACTPSGAWYELYTNGKADSSVGPCLGKDGSPGTPGATGSSASDDQVAAAVAAYCDAHNACAGANGSDGAAGANGSPGANGAPPSGWTYTDMLGAQHTCSPVEGFDPGAPRYSCN